MTDLQKKILSTEFSWVKTDSLRFSQAMDAIFETKDNLVIVGSGGVGKSVLLKMAARMLPGKTVVLSTTGVSAANLAGEGVVTATVHSFFRFPPVTVIEEPVLYTDLAPVMQNVDTILIDEISMLNASNMDTMLKLLRKYRVFCDESLPRIIMFGDVLQLPPVVESRNEVVRHLFERKYGGKIMFFNAGEYGKANFKVLHLNQIYRQNDVDWQFILNNIRLGTQTERELKALNTRVVQERDFIRKHDTMMFLCATNKRVQALNNFYLDEDNGKTFYAVTDGSFELKGTNYQPEITIAPGMQVMCTKNDKQGEYQNGTLGIVLSVDRDTVTIRDKDYNTIEVHRDTWEQYEYTYDREKDTVEHKVVGTFNQIACVPAFAATIHKAQGLTLDAMLLDPTALNYMSPSLAYVALSRCTTMEGVGLTRPLRMSDIVTNQEGVDFLRKHELFGRM